MLLAVIFDLDGTLIDSTDAIVRSFNHMFDTLGEPRASREAIVGSIGHPLEEQLTFLTSLDVRTCVEVYREHYEQTAQENTTLLPGTREILEALDERGVRVGFATSKKREAAEMLLAHLGVLEYFAARVGPYEVTHTKPHPEPIQKAMALLGSEPHATAYVGDMHFDILASRAAGVYTVGVATGYATREELASLAPDALFDDLFGVREHLLMLASGVAVEVKS